MSVNREGDYSIYSNFYDQARWLVRNFENSQKERRETLKKLTSLAHNQLEALEKANLANQNHCFQSFEKIVKTYLSIKTLNLSDQLALDQNLYQFIALSLQSVLSAKEQIRQELRKTIEEIKSLKDDPSYEKELLELFEECVNEVVDLTMALEIAKLLPDPTKQAEALFTLVKAFIEHQDFSNASVVKHYFPNHPIGHEYHAKGVQYLAQAYFVKREYFPAIQEAIFLENEEEKKALIHHFVQELLERYKKEALILLLDFSRRLLGENNLSAALLIAERLPTSPEKAQALYEICNAYMDKNELEQAEIVQVLHKNCADELKAQLHQ